VRVKSGQLYQPEALGISAELKAKVCCISLSLCSYLPPGFEVHKHACGNIEREATENRIQEHLVGISYIL
jgi:hypothetical protein